MAGGLTDAQMQEMVKNGQAMPVATPQGGISDEEMQNMVRRGKATPLMQDEPGLLRRVGDFAKESGKEFYNDIIVPVGRTVDKYAGAPTRAALGEIITPEKGMLGAAKAFGAQFGEDPEKAPTGKELAQRLGVPDTSASDVFPSAYSKEGDWLRLKKGGLLDPTASGLAGLGIDIGADITNVIPFGAAAKGIGKLGKGALKVGAEGIGGIVKGAAKGADWLAEGEKATKAVEAVGSTAKSIGNVIGNIRKSSELKISPEFTKFASVAEKHGIDPELLPSTIKYGEASPITRAEQAASMGIGGQDLIEHSNKAFDAVDQAAERSIGRISKGALTDPISAGEGISQGFQQATKNLFDENAIRYSNLHQLNPGMVLTPEAHAAWESTLNGVEKQAKGMMKRGATGEQIAAAKDMLGTVQRLRQSQGSVKQLSEQIGYIGQAAFAPQSSFKKLAPDQKGLQQIYHSLGDALEKTADDLAPEIGAQLKSSNKNIKDFMQNLEPIKKALDSKTVAPENLLKMVTSDSKRVKALTTMLPQESLAQLKGALADALIKRTKDGEIIYGASLRELQKNAPRLKGLFSPDELSDIVEVLTLGDKMGGRLSSAVRPTGMIQGLINLPKKVLHSGADREIISRMKEAADKGLLKEPGLLEEATQSTSKRGEMAAEMPLDILKKIKDMRRSRMEMGLKGAQSVAPSSYRSGNE